MAARLCRIAGFLLLAGAAVAEAAPNIPPSELPGRDRQRFAPSPLDRFTDPFASPRNAEPLWQWQCDNATARRSAKKSKRKKEC